MHCFIVSNARYVQGQGAERSGQHGQHVLCECVPAAAVAHVRVQRFSRHERGELQGAPEQQGGFRAAARVGQAARDDVGQQLHHFAGGLCDGNAEDRAHQAHGPVFGVSAERRGGVHRVFAGLLSHGAGARGGDEGARGCAQRHRLRGEGVLRDDGEHV